MVCDIRHAVLYMVIGPILHFYKLPVVYKVSPETAIELRKLTNGHN